MSNLSDKTFIVSNMHKAQGWEVPGSSSNRNSLQPLN